MEGITVEDVNMKPCLILYSYRIKCRQSLYMQLFLSTEKTRLAIISKGQLSKKKKKKKEEWEKPVSVHTLSE